MKRISIPMRWALSIVLLAAWAVGAQTPPTGLEIAEEYMFLSGQPAAVGVFHIIDIVNPGPETAPTVVLPLLAGARDVHMEGESFGVVIEGGRAEDMTPLPPENSRRYTVRYAIPGRSGPYAIQRELSYPIDQSLLWAEATRYRLTGIGVRPLGSEAIGDVEFNVYQMQNVRPGTWQAVVEPADYRGQIPMLNNFQIHGNPMEFIAAMARTLGTWLLVAGIAAGVLVAVSASFRRTRRPRAEINKEMERQREKLIDLETEYRRGEVDEKTYAQTREKFKEAILVLMESEAKAKRAKGTNDTEVESGV